MNTLRIIYHVALADFFERARRYRFLVILAAIICMGVLVANGSAFLDVGTGGEPPYSPRYRGELNSAWIGTMTVLVTNTFLGLFGFYLVSDCIERDIRTGVGQIIATTPVRRAIYLVGKWISNFAVLSVLVLILAAAAVIMVLLQSDAVLEVVSLLMPFVAVALPYMALIAALAVVFETVPRLRGAAGNAVYFFLWLLLSASSITWENKPSIFMDPMGVDVFRASLYEGARMSFPNELIGGIGVGIDPAHEMLYKIFNWSGLTWTPGIVGRQSIWIVVGLGLILLSALWFTRFDPSKEGVRHRQVKSGNAEEDPLAATPKRTLGGALRDLFSPFSKLAHRFNLSPLVSKLAQVNPFMGVLFAELRMLLNGRRWWWWAVTVGLNVAILVTPFSMTKEYLLPIAWLWLMPVLSAMGNRERKNNTHQMVFSSARPVLRQLPAAWLAGFLVTALFTAAGWVVLIANRDLLVLAGWVGAVLFVPTLALALGVFSSGSRAFEVVYVVWWYIGPMQKTPGMDFTRGPLQFYLLAAAGLLLLSAFWRGRQVRA